MPDDCDEGLRRLGGGAVTAELEHPEQEEERRGKPQSPRWQGATGANCGI